MTSLTLTRQGNVLIDDDHGACLSDFGLSVLARDFDLPSMSRFSSGIGGSIRWTAPELYVFDGDASPRLTLQTDVYSFGSVAYEVHIVSLSPLPFLEGSASNESVSFD